MEVALCPLMGGQEGDTGDFQSCLMVPFQFRDTLPELQNLCFLLRSVMWL